MINTFVYTKTIFDAEKFLKNTGNVFELVAQRPYRDKKGILPDGVTVTLHILQDNGEYGIDKDTGRQRCNNKGQNFDVTILCGSQFLNIQQGERVSLMDFDSENSYVIKFDLCLRFKGIKKVAVSNSTPSMAQTVLSKGLGTLESGGSSHVKKLG